MYHWRSAFYQQPTYQCGHSISKLFISSHNFHYTQQSLHALHTYHSHFFFFLCFVSFLQLCGIALVSVGLAFLLKYDDILKSFEELNVNVAPYGFIAIGSLIFLIAFFGCCGAIRESHCMVSTVSIYVASDCELYGGWSCVIHDLLSVCMPTHEGVQTSPDSQPNSVVSVFVWARSSLCDAMPCHANSSGMLLANRVAEKLQIDRRWRRWWRRRRQRRHTNTQP